MSKRRDSPRTEKKYFTVGTLGGYLRLLNKTKIASCAAKRTSAGRGRAQGRGREAA